jgi:hypothetical protein
LVSLGQSGQKQNQKGQHLRKGLSIKSTKHSFSSFFAVIKLIIYDLFNIKLPWLEKS